MQEDKQLFIGIDGGGTKCRARLENLQGELLGEGLAGSANPLRSYDVAIDSILQSSLLAMESIGLSEKDFNRTSVVLGLAGVNIPKYFTMVNNWQHPYANMHLTTDLHIACLGAHAGKDGAIAICGTGSSGFSNIEGVQTLFGGHGFPLGDKGSGAWLGWQALVYTLESFDEIRPSTPLTDYITTHFNAGCAEDIVEASIKYVPAMYAKLSPYVIEFYEKGDPNAVLIVNDAIAYLENLIQRLNRTNPPRISMIGGLANTFTAHFSEQIQALLSAPLCSPEKGAVDLAKFLFKEKSNDN